MHTVLNRRRISMKRGILIFNFLILIASFPLFSEVREIKSMKEILKEVDSQTLLVFDLDNTLMEPVQSLGSDQWYYYIIKKYKEADKLNDQEAYDKSDKVWNQTQWLIEVKAVEAITPEIIRNFQKRKIKMMGLTARTYDLSDITLKQLASVGIHLGQSVSSQNLEFKLVDTAHFVDGIVFQGEHNSKGEVFVEFLKRVNLRPKKVVFVDDKQKHVNSMEKALGEAKIKYVGFRYGATDERVQRFNKDFEDYDLFCNGNWSQSAEEKFKSKKPY